MSNDRSAAGGGFDQDITSFMAPVSVEAFDIAVPAAQKPCEPDGAVAPESAPEDALEAIEALASDDGAREVEAPDPASLASKASAFADEDAPAADEAQDREPTTTDADPQSTGKIDPLEVAAMAARETAPDQTLPFEPVAAAPVSYSPLGNSDSTRGAARGTGHLSWSARTDVGRVREHNEDSYVVHFPLFAVADGMGGHAAGEVASAIAATSLANCNIQVPDDARLGAAVEAANQAVLEGSANGLGRPGMGTTCTAVVIDGGTMAVAHVGDSRCYLLHAGRLTRVTHDHSYVEELVAAGQITPEEARVHPNRSVITRALGNDPNMKPDHFQVAVTHGDRILLCSDGLSSMVPDSDIEELLVSTTSPQAATEALVQAACNAGGHDNVTCLVVDVKDDGTMAQALRKRIANVVTAVVITLAVLAGAAAILGTMARSTWYLADLNGYVALYQGLPGLQSPLLTDLKESTSVKTSDLSDAVSQRLEAGITFDSEDEARAALEEYRSLVDAGTTASTASVPASATASGSEV